MQSEQLTLILEQIQESYSTPSTPLDNHIRKKMHYLAELQYQKAIPFFLSCLDDARWDWRQHCVVCLGFHYVYSQDNTIVAKIRELLLKDDNAFVRIAAASVLASQMPWPESTLIQALTADDDPDVRLAVFDALLSQAGIPPFMAFDFVERARQGELPLTLDTIERIRDERMP